MPVRVKRQYLLVILVTFSSCLAKKQISDDKKAGFSYNYCSPNVPYVLTLPDEGAFLQATAMPLSEHDRLLCSALGISSEADSLWRLHQQKSPPDSMKILFVKQRITAKLLIAQSQLQAVAAELDCEGERSNQAASYLDGINNNKKNSLTVASVALGAFTTVATVLISKKGLQTGIGIGGGLLSAGLAALTINPKGENILFYHQRNLLRTIWNGTANNTDYPYFVWRMLHESKFSNKGNVTLANSVRSRWLQFNFDGKITPKQEALIFGNGGLYHAEELHIRAALINQLQATIRSVNQDLTGTIAVIETL